VFLPLDVGIARVLFVCLEIHGWKCLQIRRLLTFLTHVQAQSVADQVLSDMFESCKCCSS
jgi:hypothetical protein